MEKFATIILVVAAAAGGWFLRPHFGGGDDAGSSGGRKIQFYQSAMHPWVKSDKPGRCTICGMELTPVYEGQKGFDDAGGDVVALTQNQIQVLHVETAEAKVQPLSRALLVAGMIDDNATRHRLLSAYTDGRVDKLHVNFVGAEVTENQPLAEFYSPSLLAAEREYRQLTGDLRKNTALRLRQMGLSNEQVAALDKKPADALTSQILSPIGGTVVGQNVYEGQYVTAGEKLFEIADFSTMWFQFRAYEQDIPWIELGQTVAITTPSLPGKTIEGKITFIDPNFDEATRSTKVRVELENPIVNGKRLLLHRLYADGTVKMDVPAVLSVPRSSVIETGPESVVYIDKGDGAYARTVIKLGRRGDNLLEVLSGLKAGDKVVTNGNLLIDGQAEMNRSFMTPVAPKTPANPSAPLNDSEQKALNQFLTMADAMSAALADDNLAAFNKASQPAMAETEALVKAFESRKEVAQQLAALNEARHFHGFDDLQKARVAFHKFTVAATAGLEPLRNVKGAPEFEVFECSMVNQAIPDAPKKGRWVQVGGRPGHNPFFGKDMLDCAAEIKKGGAKP